MYYDDDQQDILDAAIETLNQFTSEEINQALENLIDMGLVECVEDPDGEIYYQITDSGQNIVDMIYEANYRIN